MNMHINMTHESGGKIQTAPPPLSPISKIFARMRRIITVFICIGGGVFAHANISAADEVNIYSYRQPQLIRPMLDAFTADSGIRVNAIYAKKGMLQRLRSEGANSPADVVFTVDIGRLADIKNAGLTQAVKSKRLRNAIPENVRDPDGHWFGLTARARIIIASKSRVAPGEITRYEQLADEKWRGRICTRSGKHPYNVALFASMLHIHGETETMRWLVNVKNNLARRPQGNDRAQAKAVAEGVCDVAVINHYYLHKMLRDPKQRAWAESVAVIFPNQSGRGAHMNISGMAMARHAPNRKNALRLMEFLSGMRAQEMYARVNGEYPVDESVALPADLRALGEFKRDTLALEEIAARRAAASKLVDRAGYNN